MIYYLVGLLSVAWIPRLEWIPLIFLLLLPLTRIARLRLPMLLYIAGGTLAALWGGWQLMHRLPDQYARKDVVLVGTVDGLVTTRGERQSFTLAVRGVENRNSVYQRLRRVKLSLYRSSRKLHAGQVLRMRVRLKPPRGLSNPYAFDVERRLLSRHIDAQGYVRELLAVDPSFIGVDALRERLRASINRVFDPVTAATLSALVVGDRSGLTGVQWRLLSQTGTAHLMVVSGLHIAVMSGLGLLVARLLALPLRLGGLSGLVLRRFSLVFAIVSSASYAMLAGLGLPVQRALIMVAIFLLAEWRLQVIHGWRRWRWALAGVTLWQPLAVAEPGFWLSFGAVAILIWIAQHRQRAGNWLARWWQVQGQLFIIMLPLTALLFHQLGLLSPVVNLVALPFISLLVMALPLLLPLSLWIKAGWVTAGLGYVVVHFWDLLAAVRSSLGLYVALTPPTFIALLFAICAACWWSLPFPLRWRWLALVMMMPLLSGSQMQEKRGEFVATVFDVGQGLAVLIETADGPVVYDTGPGFPDGGSRYPFTMAPLLRARRIDRLSMLVLSHDDLDHTGGTADLLKDVDARRVFSGEPERFAGLKGRACHGPADRRLGGIDFRFYSLSGATLSDNARSCVLWVKGAHCTLLLSGDLDQAGERELLTHMPSGRVDWLVAGHHGSKTATSIEWLQAFDPVNVIFSRGRFNPFGHPSKPVVDRVKATGAEIHDTATEGALSLDGRSKECEVSGQRAQKRRYWTAS